MPGRTGWGNFRWARAAVSAVAAVFGLFLALWSLQIVIVQPAELLGRPQPGTLSTGQSSVLIPAMLVASGGLTGVLLFAAGALGFRRSHDHTSWVGHQRVLLVACALGVFGTGVAAYGATHPAFGLSATSRPYSLVSLAVYAAIGLLAVLVARLGRVTRR